MTSYMLRTYTICTHTKEKHFQRQSKCGGRCAFVLCVCFGWKQFKFQLQLQRVCVYTFKLWVIFEWATMTMTIRTTSGIIRTYQTTIPLQPIIMAVRVYLMPGREQSFTSSSSASIVEQHFDTYNNGK